jgi:hypothetical protein
MAANTPLILSATGFGNGLTLSATGWYGGEAPAGVGGGGGGGGAATENLYLGSTQPTSIYIGSTQVTAVYKGSTLIWGS